MLSPLLLKMYKALLKIANLLVEVFFNLEKEFDTVNQNILLIVIYN